MVKHCYQWLRFYFELVHFFSIKVVYSQRGPVLTLKQLLLKVIRHPLYSMNNVVTNKSKLPQDGAQVFPYMG